MLQAFYNEEAVTVGGDTYRLVINFRAIDATESLLGRSYNTILGEITSPDAPLSLVGKVLWGMLREHHPDVSLDQTASLLFGETGIKVGMAVSKLLNAAFSEAEDKPEAKGKNPRKPRGASKVS